ncbi:MAG: entericidin A/B family lipoprotein [Panacagrimonas sp.]
MKNLIAGLFTASALLGMTFLSGCNTMEGAGKDVERAGEKIQTATCTTEESKTDPACKK